MANLNYDSRFVNSITLCFQGGIEGLHMTFANNPNVKLDKYIIQVVSGGKDLSAFKNNIEQLDQMYDDISIVVMCDGKLIYGEMNNTQEKANTDKPLVKDEPKKGFFAKLFGKK